MTISLLDVNILLALLDPTHTFHASAAHWFRNNADEGWATCPITQNGFIRIASHRSYPQPRTVNEARSVLQAAIAHPSHTFWPDSHSLTDDASVNPDHLLRSGQVTDTYLLGVAVKCRGSICHIRSTGRYRCSA